MYVYDKWGRRAIVRAYDPLPFFARIFIRLRLAILPLEEIEAMVPSGTIADIGCGYGILAHYIAYKDPRRVITGIERNVVLVRRAEKTIRPYESLRFIEGDAEEIFLEKYNGVIICDLLHHLSMRGQEYILRAVKKSLHPRGRIVIKDIEKEQSVWYYWNLFHDRVMRFSGPTFHRTADEWAKIVRDLGFVVVEQQHFRHFLYHHIIIVAECL